MGGWRIAGGEAVKLLFDTHTFVWWLLADGQLTRTARTALDDPANRLYVSAVVGWEIATKHRIGKLPEGARVLGRLKELMPRLAIDPLPITLEHGVTAGSFQSTHRDPFDRMIAAQAQIENMAIVTGDRAFREFPVETLW